MEGKHDADVQAEQLRIGRRIEELRRDAGLSQVQLARAAAMSIDGVSRILLGRRAPHLGSLMALGKALNVDYRELMADPELPVERSPFREDVRRVGLFLQRQKPTVTEVVEACAHAIARGMA